MSKRPYRLLLTWQHRKWGPQLHKTNEEASSIRRAINQMLKAFFTNKNRRKERLDAHASLTISVQRMKRHDSLVRAR